MTSYLHRIARYHNWATAGLLEFLGTLPPTVLDERIPGVFGSILESVDHMVSSDVGYQRSLAGLPRPERPGTAERVHLGPLTALANEAADNLIRLIDSLPEPSEMLSLRDGHRSAATVLTQLVMHGAEHRAHISTILGSLGIEPPELDAWAHGIFAEDDDWPDDWGAKPDPMPKYPPPGLN